MRFHCLLKGQFYIGEGTNTWVHGREHAILSGHFLGYMYWLVFSEKCNHLKCWFFRFLFFLLDYGCTIGKCKLQDILPFSLPWSCKYDEFFSLFYVAKLVEE